MSNVMSDIISTIIAQGAKEMNIELPPDAKAAFGAYFDFLEKHGKNVNLTAITGAEDIARLHFLDSLALTKITSFENARIIDIGSGAGFPGVPLKIAIPSIDLTLLDSMGKRITFLSELCARLSIQSVLVKARAEEVAHLPKLREMHDIVVSRAVARLNVLCELCLPFARVGGVFVAMKSVDSDEELDEANLAIKTLGAKLHESFDYSIPTTDITHRAVVINKVEKTPQMYPRRFKRIQKEPL